MNTSRESKLDDHMMEYFVLPPRSEVTAQCEYPTLAEVGCCMETLRNEFWINAQSLKHLVEDVLVSQAAKIPVDRNRSHE